MKNVRWILVAVAVLVLAGLACGGSPTEEAQPTAAPPPTEEPSPPTPMPTNTPEPEPEGATLEITNSSGTDVWYVYLSPSKADEWGEDWLGDNVIRDGETYTIEGIPEGIYDVKAEDENQEVIETWWEEELEGEMTWEIVGLAGFEIVNESDDMISYLYIAPSDSDTWGDDWLGDDVVKAGASYAVTGIPPGTYDLKVTDADDDAIEMVYNIDIPEKNSWTVVGMSLLPSNAVLRFEDQFEDNRNNWGSDTEGEKVYYMRPSGGEYCILIKSANQAGVEWYEPFRTDEFVAEVACRVEGADDATCGLGFGPDVDNIYWMEVSPSDQAFALFLRENGAWQDNLIDWTVTRNIKLTGKNYLSMERVEGVVSLYVNGVLVGQTDGSRFPTGRVGIGGSTYDEPNATICLDNLRVWRLE